jgi:gamma-glutamyltranspeptidase/glutathione hydrolase
MVVTNHPLASAAGAEMLAAGGNAIDATVAAFFALSVVEPMMVGIFGGGTAHLRFADGRHTIIDGMSTAPLAARPDTYRPISDGMPDYQETVDRENSLGPKAVAVPGTLKGWCETLSRFGTLSLADVMAPALRHATDGFRVTPYLSECVAECAVDLARDPEIARLYLPDDAPIAAGARLRQGAYADTLRLIARDGPDVLYGGTLGREIADHMAKVDGLITLADLSTYRTVERVPIRGTYRGFEIVGPPPPASSAVHIVQMLNILERYDIAGMGFGSADVLHLLAECLKIAFADRAVATADPAFVTVPIEKLTAKEYAAVRSARIEMSRAQTWGAGVARPESANTTHVTVADGDGNVVASTQTINSLFGARFIVPGTGMVLNNYMHLFDPHPGTAQSIAPGKRVTTSMSPVMALKDGKPRFALGLPGGLRIFGSAMQALVNLIDHGMSLQEAVEAPRLWTQGQAVELESGFPEPIRTALGARGHDVADGVAIGIGGGLARANVRFWPDRARI